MEGININGLDYRRLRNNIKEVYSVVEETIKKATNIVDEGRNYSIEIVEDINGDIDIILIKGENRISLKEKYLPENYKFIEGDIFTVNHSMDNFIMQKIKNEDEKGRGKEKHYQKLRFDKHSVNNKYFLLRLLHEIGHIHDRETNKKLISLSKDEFLAKRQGFLKKIFLLIKNKDFSFLERKNFFPAWYLNKFQEIKALSERNARTWAIKEARKLEKDGFNILDSGYKDFIKNSLLTYELSSINDRVLSDLIIENKDLDLFVKKSSKSLLKKLEK